MDICKFIGGKWKETGRQREGREREKEKKMPEITVLWPDYINEQTQIIVLALLCKFCIG